MIPMGYEYGFKKRLNVVETRPQDWETPTYDLTPFLKSVNRMKRNARCSWKKGLRSGSTPRGSR